jgi:hypothetical protein
MNAVRTRRGPMFVAAVAAFVIALNVGAVAAFHAAFPGVSLLPATAAGPPPKAKPAPVVPVAARTGALPAQAAVASVIAVNPRALAGWKAATSTTTVAGAPFDYACGTPDGPAPVVATSRGWVASTGPLPRHISGTVSVTVRAYGAGQGAVAFAQQKATVNDCVSAFQASRSGIGVDAMAIRSSSASTLMWRRGDVTVLLSTSSAGRPGNLATLAPVAAEFDTRLVAALTGVCADVTSTREDATRSPYANRAGFTGLTVPRTVTLDAGALAATSEPSTSAPVVPIPAPRKDVPYIGDLPERPASPVTPSALPKKVARPSLPDVPVPGPTATTVREAVEDATGPGCGWVFAGQGAPSFNAAQATAALAAATKTAQANLAAGHAKWVAAKGTYYVEYAQYLKDVDAFTAYAAQVEKVRAVWAKVRAERAEYQRALDRYTDAVRARERFLADQQRAQEEYAAALTACATTTGLSPAGMQVKTIGYVAEPVPPTPSPTPSPSPTVSPQPTPSPKPSPSVSPKPSVTPSPSPSPSATPQRVCPPPRPAILDEVPPEVPVKPVPPVSSGAGVASPAPSAAVTP